MISTTPNCQLETLPTASVVGEAAAEHQVTPGVELKGRSRNCFAIILMELQHVRIKSEQARK